MRFVLAGEPVPTLDDLGRALVQQERGYRLERTGAAAADLLLHDDVIAEIEINAKGDDIFDDELAELLEAIAEADGNTDRVTAALRSSPALVAVRVLFGGRESEGVLEQLAPFWEHLFDKHRGLLQADGEGYYDGDELILAVE